ncbi:DUF3263 domain-containing protein [Modestobacter sp. I12A-02662]|uniref:DUF3263 domain-containing protein n=1 Tax=Modestobacter sp. I12A-02662 TaxID=1730496 RepID=UPI0034DF601F
MSTDTAFADPGTEPVGQLPEGGAGGADEAVEVAGTVDLPAREREMLAFERQWWRYAGAKEAAIRERFGLSATRYYQVLNALVDRPEALAADPLLVRRLRRMRATRQRHRSGQVLRSDRRPG